MHDENLLCLMALNRVGGIKTKHVSIISDALGDLAVLKGMPAEEITASTGIDDESAGRIASQFGEKYELALAQADDCVKRGINIISYKDASYPQRLLECHDFPPVLFYKGQDVFEGRKYLAVVGTRGADDYGLRLCEKMVRDLAAEFKDLCIVSGLAFGIDICAQKTALSCGISTIGVLGGGLGRIYPRNHEVYADAIYGCGVLVSEYYNKDISYGQNFLARNRIIAGLSDAVVVVQSAYKGGSLNTATVACSYNRDVFAFPGRVGDSLSEGCNALIMQHKAEMICSAKDLLYFLPWKSEDSKPSGKKSASSPPAPESLKPSLSEEFLASLPAAEAAVCKALAEYKKLHKDSIAMIADVPDLSSTLLSLEFKGIIKCLPGNVYELY